MEPPSSYPRAFWAQRQLLFQAEPAKALVERSDAAAFLDLAVAAGPCRVAGRVDVEGEDVAFLAPGGAGLKLGAIGHFDRDHVIVGVPFGLHGLGSFIASPRFRPGLLCMEKRAR